MVLIYLTGRKCGLLLLQRIKVDYIVKHFEQVYNKLSASIFSRQHRNIYSHLINLRTKRRENAK